MVFALCLWCPEPPRDDKPLGGFILRPGGGVDLRYAVALVGGYTLLLALAPELDRCEPGRLRAAKLRALEIVIRMGDSQTAGMFNFDDVPLQAEPKDFEALADIAANLDFDAPINIQFTSGTTGNPKGVLYSHRSTILHAYASIMPDAMGMSARDTILPIVPMFHANAWGLAHAAVATGANLVMPGPDLSGPSIANLIRKNETFKIDSDRAFLGIFKPEALPVWIRLWVPAICAVLVITLLMLGSRTSIGVTFLVLAGLLFLEK